ncbi:MAG: DUF4390 domain-containing protein [Deltaproteobacteria bacterium]|nr:DUF4390 domain-containing protein [Deltaproteobacteria bacterium]
MRFSTITIAVLLLTPTSLLFAASARKPEIVNIRGQVHGKEARVSFVLRNAFTPEMVEALKSGIEISFKTEVRVERVYRNWFDQTVGATRFSRSVRYDVLSRVYHLNRGRGDEILPDIFAALAGMTRYEVVVPLLVEVERGKGYRAYVRSHLDRVGLSEPLRSILFFSSLWDVKTGWERGNLEAP